MSKIRNTGSTYQAPSIEKWSIKNTISILHTLSTDIIIDSIEEGDDIIIE